MPALTLALLGAGLLAAPAPALAQRRLEWLIAGRGSNPAPRRARRLPQRARQALTDGWLGGAVAGSLAGVTAAVTAGPVPGLLAAITCWVLLRCLRLLSAERDGERRRAELAAAVGALQDEYAAGATVAAAFSAAATASGRFAAVLARAATLADDGSEVAAALRTDATLASLAVACAAAASSGAPLSQPLAGVQADLAADQRTYRAVRTALAGPRSSALLLAGLPLIGVAMGAAMGAHPERVLLHTTAGLGALVAGVVLDLTGMAWTLALSRRALRALG
ncbi:MAG TPA: type II secretion system F family protein [Jatrophihabitans sp.]|jgi:tight adherence protein B|uniref:type II secretion system F family protein n=1 Tax=Jatrophihabitans sp. TaxID=1932789 RepID=UPI002EEB4E98